METQVREISSGALEMFFRCGVRNVSMDDIAGELGVSKKTIYKFFRNKAHLVDECIMNYNYQIHNEIEHICHKMDNAIEELFAIDKFLSAEVQKHHPAIIFQLQKYYPETFKKLFSKRKAAVLTLTRDNLLTGIEQGLYRADIKVEIISHLYFARILMIADEESFPMDRFSLAEVLHEGIIYHIRGIASERGIAYLEQKLNEQ